MPEYGPELAKNLKELPFPEAYKQIEGFKRYPLTWQLGAVFCDLVDAASLVSIKDPCSPSVVFFGALSFALDRAYAKINIFMPRSPSLKKSADLFKRAASLEVYSEPMDRFLQTGREDFAKEVLWFNVEDDINSLRGIIRIYHPCRTQLPAVLSVRENLWLLKTHLQIANSFRRLRRFIPIKYE